MEVEISPNEHQCIRSFINTKQLKIPDGIIEVFTMGPSYYEHKCDQITGLTPDKFFKRITKNLVAKNS